MTHSIDGNKYGLMKDLPFEKQAEIASDIIHKAYLATDDRDAVSHKWLMRAYDSWYAEDFSNAYYCAKMSIKFTPKTITIGW